MKPRIVVTPVAFAVGRPSAVMVLDSDGVLKSPEEMPAHWRTHHDVRHRLQKARTKANVSNKGLSAAIKLELAHIAQHVQALEMNAEFDRKAQIEREKNIPKTTVKDQW